MHLISKEILQKAKELSKDYHIVLEGDQKSGFIGTCVEIPTFIGIGDTKEIVNMIIKDIEKSRVGIKKMQQEKEEQK